MNSDRLIRIPGNSGCRLEVLLDRGPLVRKTSDSIEYATRLDAQRRKQEAYSERSFPGVVVPKVLQHGELWFEMEYLRMIDCIRFFERASPKLIEGRITILLDLVAAAVQRSKTIRLDDCVIAAKIESVSAGVPQEVWNRFYAPYAELILSDSRNGLDVAVGDCHGDLTLSNVLFSFDREEIGLIDFLDSFVEAPIIDIVKIRQDTRFHWTSTIYPHDHDRSKVRLTNRWIDRMVESEFRHLLKEPAFRAMELMNYLRIAPYVTEPADHEWLNQVLSTQVAPLICD
jgi:hypothetical protein